MEIKKQEICYDCDMCVFDLFNPSTQSIIIVDQQVGYAVGIAGDSIDPAQRGIGIGQSLAAVGVSYLGSLAELVPAVAGGQNIAAIEYLLACRQIS